MPAVSMDELFEERRARFEKAMAGLKAEKAAAATAKEE
jgi:hypothetical protein